MLLNQIQSDLKDAQLNKDEVKTSTLRLLLSEIKNKEISKGGVLSDEDVVAVIRQELKKRKEAAQAFRLGDREEAALKEEAEAAVLESYLPPAMSDEELSKIVKNTINELEASSLADIGKVMGAVMGKVKGQADGSKVSALVKEKLSK